MSNISVYPLQDNFKTTLSQQWDGATGTVYVASTPSFTFPAGVTTYIVASPGKTTMQIAKISAYDATAKTLTVSSISLKKGASINSTAQTHSVGAEIIISDNYQFWEDIYTAVNTKVDGNVQGFPNYADATARDAAITSPSNGMMIYNTGAGEFQVYQSGAWTSLASGSTQPNASATVAGKVEIGTQGEVDSVTDIGGTGAILSVIPSTLDAKVMKQTSLVNGGITGEVKMWTTATPPTNWLICDGSSLLRAGTYAALFAVIGTTYGTADGTHFNIPDFRGRSPLGSGTGTATGATAHALGETPTSGVGGEEKHTLITDEIPSHTHPVYSMNSGSGASNNASNLNYNATTVTGTSGATGGGLGHNIMSPHTAINFIIRI